MYGRHYFGGRYFGARYFGDGGTGEPEPAVAGAFRPLFRPRRGR